MKKFKDLKKDDIVLILTIDPLKRSTMLKSSTITVVFPETKNISNVTLCFREVTEDILSVPGDCSFLDISIDKGKPVKRYIFADPGSLDEFLKKEIADYKKFANHLEALHNVAWSYIRCKKSELTVGKVYFHKNISNGVACIISKDGGAIDWDGFKISANNMASDSIRAATREEVEEFYERLRKTLMIRTHKEGLIENLETCGLSWNSAIKQIVRI